MCKKTAVLIITTFYLGVGEVKIKFATLAPSSSSWGRCLSQIARSVRNKTDKNVLIKVYYGAKMGDEEEMAKKITVGQLDGAAFTGNGLGHVCSEARVVEMPFLFNSSEEVRHIYDLLEYDLNFYFKKNKFHLISLTETGNAYFFSKASIHNLTDVSKTKMWVWKGDRVAEVMMQAVGIPAIAINFTEVIPSLQTGLIDGFYCTLTAAISLQWHLEAKYLLNQPACNVSGGVVMSEVGWNKLSPEEQKILTQESKKYIKILEKKNHQSDKETLELLKQNGYQINAYNGDFNEFSEIRNQVVKKMIDLKIFPESLYRKVETDLKRYRK